jgi:lysophospholipase L1-like esterase
MNGMLVLAAAVMAADPNQPNRLLPAYNSGDGVHPNDVGYLAMANASDLSFFR